MAIGTWLARKKVELVSQPCGLWSALDGPPYNKSISASSPCGCDIGVLSDRPTLLPATCRRTSRSTSLVVSLRTLTMTLTSLIEWRTGTTRHSPKSVKNAIWRSSAALSDCVCDLLRSQRRRSCFMRASPYLGFVEYFSALSNVWLA